LPDLKAAGLRDVVLLNVISPDQVPLGHGADRELLDQLRWTNQEKLDLMRMALEGQGFSVRCRLEEGHPADEIVRIAREESVQLVVMGAQGKSLVQELLLGSVAWDVVRHAPVPVLVEKFEVIRELGDVRCQRVCAETFEVVLHPTDFSDCANNAFNIVKHLKSAGTERVILLHVQNERAMQYRPQQQKDEFDQEDMRRLEHMQKALRWLACPARYCYALASRSEKR
jgi:nucleotide-binding universal stress UspA family protein